MLETSFADWILGFLLVLSSLGVILSPKPVHAGLFFLLTLLLLSGLYFLKGAPLIAVMQILIYAGAILVVFMFVMILFQDAHQAIAKALPQSALKLLIAGAVAFSFAIVWLGKHLFIDQKGAALPEGFGTPASLGERLFVDYFFPFEAITLLMLVALVGALYIGRKETL